MGVGWGVASSLQFQAESWSVREAQFIFMNPIRFSIRSPGKKFTSGMV